MEIVSYRDLESDSYKEQLSALIDLAFNISITTQEGELISQIDARLRDGPVGFCAVESDRLAGFLGVMDIPTRTLQGSEEMCAGIWGGTTNPVFLKLLQGAINISDILS